MNNILNPEAEKYIFTILQKDVPYQIQIANATFIISNKMVFPPGELTQLFAEYLMNNDLIQDKTIIDAGAACFALGIIAAKNGAKTVIGIDISEQAVHCANENIIINQVSKTAQIMHGSGLSPVIPKYLNQVDLLLCGPPWDSMTQEDFESMSFERKEISRAFYDIEDALISDVFSKGPKLLNSGGKILITASKRIMDRIMNLCSIYKTSYSIVKEKDIHQDGNIHYILEIRSMITYA